MGKLYWKHFAAAIAALSAAATLLTALFDLDSVKECWICGSVGALIVLIGSFAYARWQTKSKKEISMSLSSTLKLTIREGDLFCQKGIICIPFNEFFDTHVGDGVIDKGSLQGLFIYRFFGDRIDELNSKIQNGLSNVGYTVSKRRLNTCPNKKYPLGTCVKIREGENTYVLFALSHFDDNDKASVSRIEYTTVVHSLMTYLASVSEANTVYFPLFGAGLSRMRRTPQRILLHLVDTLDFNDSYSIPGGVIIMIKDLSDVGVNLTLLEHVVKKGISEIEE